jgi:hypothetical protein
MEHQLLAVTGVLAQHLPFLAHPLPMPVAAVAVLSTEEQPELVALVAVVTVRLRRELLAQTELIIRVVAAVVGRRMGLPHLLMRAAQAALAS